MEAKYYILRVDPSDPKERPWGLTKDAAEQRLSRLVKEEVECKFLLIEGREIGFKVQAYIE